ncbi:DUF2569 family protein [Gorillibacterium massiliense]|uniref:DUF2569 family protein n=1 Tax=Gorillibacterium massiliense TaxID=1280390 RepID=UPI000592F2E0|nr:DUF2569 family protein [Gorillibacterium massiliense]
MSNKETAELNSKPIGGWLLAYLVILIIREALYVSFSIKILSNFSYIIEESNWIQNAITVGLLIKMIATGIILMLFITKKKYALYLIITLELLCIVVRILTYTDFISRGQTIPVSYNLSILIGMISLTWITYFLRSKRVKETFVKTDDMNLM